MKRIDFEEIADRLFPIGIIFGFSAIVISNLVLIVLLLRLLTLL